jgi:copper chaperone
MICGAGRARIGVVLRYIPHGGIYLNTERAREEPAMTNHEYLVTGMTCGHCEHAVRDEVSQIPGVTAIEVSAATGLLTVTADTLDDSAVLSAVDEAGYQAARL